MKRQWANVAASRESARSLLATLLRDADDLILVTDARLRLLFVNPSLERATGRPAAEMLQRSVVEAGVLGPSAPALQEALQRALASATNLRLELEWPLDGEDRVYDVRISLDHDAPDAPRVLARARDTTEQRRIERDLRLRERDFRTLAENSPDNIIRYGLDRRAVYCNREIGDRVTVSATRVVGRTPSEAAPPGMGGVQAYEEQLARTLATGARGTVELHVPHPCGETRIHSVAFAPEHDATGAICGAVAVGRDVTEQMRVQQALAAKEREFRTLAENAGDNIVRWDTDARVRYCNPAMARLFGHLPDAVVGLAPTQLDAGTGVDLTPAEQAVRRVARNGRDEMIELRLRLPGSPTETVHQIRLVPERDATGAVSSVLGIGRDISEKIAHLELIESLVRTDPLTRLANRQALHERAPGLFAAAERHGGRVGLMVLDLDEFKAINDGLGHSAGDALLCEVARRLGACLRANDLLVRLGGDEFVIVAPDADDAQDLYAIAAKLHAALAQPMPLQHREVRTTASIGVSVYPQDGELLEQLLAHADTAMYHAKRNGRARTEYYRAELGEAVRRRLLLEQAMRGACDGTGLELHYQPLVDLAGAPGPVGAEALLRWNHPTLGLLAPDAFIGLAEETGMILPIGRWVMRSAAEAAVRWNRGRARALHVSVNVSTRQIIDDGLPALVDEVLAHTGCSPSWLWIEITESVLLQDSQRVQQTLCALRARGLRVAIDDFGTGYSALNYLARFPVDGLKIDKSFVHAIGRSRRDDELVKAFVAMATALNLSLVAEGVETAAQAEFLLAQGCGLAQGWRFGRPMPEAAFIRGLQGATAAS